MNIKSAILALGVIASLALINGPAASAQTNQTEVANQVITIQSGDTLEKIANAHDTTYVRLFNANPSIAHPDRINAGEEIRIPADDEELADRWSEFTAPVAVAQPVAAAAPAPQAAPVAPATNVTQQYTSAPVNSTSYYVGNGMWCTDYVHSKRPDVPIYGNAGYNWVSAAQAQGKATGSAPQAGAVAVMDGHVAYVESVNPDGSYVVSEMGWNYQPGNYNQRTVQPGAFGSFIY